MQYYPDTTLPRTRFAQEYERNQVLCELRPRRGHKLLEKAESWQRIVGFNGLLWNIV